MELREIKKTEDIKQGDRILVTGGKMKNEQYRVESVKKTESGDVEVLIDKKNKRHFSLGEYLSGNSWVKSVMIVVKK